MIKATSLFDNLPTTLPQEIFQDLLVTDHVRIERIISHGHVTDDGWYDQTENEWVMVIQGQAHLRFEQDNQLIELSAGMYVDIKAHTKHKVEWTTPDQPTIWLAIFYGAAKQK